MREPLPGTGLTIFLIFFGVALLNALRAEDWASVAFWMVIGAFFVWLDHPRRRAEAT